MHDPGYLDYIGACHYHQLKKLIVVFSCLRVNPGSGPDVDGVRPVRGQDVSAIQTLVEVREPFPAPPGTAVRPARVVQGPVDHLIT